MKLVSHSKKVKRFGWPHTSVQPFALNSGLLPCAMFCMSTPMLGWSWV